MKFCQWLPLTFTIQPQPLNLAYRSPASCHPCLSPTPVLLRQLPDPPCHHAFPLCPFADTPLLWWEAVASFSSRFRVQCRHNLSPPPPPAPCCLYFSSSAPHSALALHFALWYLLVSVCLSSPSHLTRLNALRSGRLIYLFFLFPQPKRMVLTRCSVQNNFFNKYAQW